MITGAGRGIGKRLAMGFAQSGSKVALLARSKPELALARLEIEQQGGQPFVYPCDVRDYTQIEASRAAFEKETGPLDVLICAAGIQGPIKPLWEADPTQWMDTMDTNFRGVVHCLRSVLPHMTARRQGKIIVLGGGGGAKSRPFFSAYGASKAAVIRLVETVADELLDHNVQINCLAPGGTYTSMTDEILQASDIVGERELEDARQVRLTGGITPERQVGLAMFLASPASNHVSGKLIHVNDDWKRLEDAQLNPELFTLRRVTRV